MVAMHSIQLYFHRLLITYWFTNLIPKKCKWAPLNHARLLLQTKIYIYTGWLKLKYPTGQNAISRQPCNIFIPNFLDFYGRDSATILTLKKNYFSFLQSYGYINILCHIFNSARNNQQQLVIFIVKKHRVLLQIQKSDK